MCAFVMMQACNEDTPVETTFSSDTMVYSFSLSDDDSVLKNLDTVFFSIDLVKAQIFNADSLPYGTRINKLVPQIKLVEGASAATIKFTTEAGTDTTTNYIDNPGDTICFSNGPAILTVASPSGTFTREYTITVNVHKVKSDSLSWGENAYSALPTTLANVTAQRTAANNNGIYCLTTDGASFSIAHTASDEVDNWTKTTVTLPAGADINSFSGAGDELYILGANGALFSSADGSTWTATGNTWKYIYGDCAGKIGGAALRNGVYSFEQYPAGVTMEIPADMPVSGTSIPVHYKAPMAEGSTSVFIGGKLADGSLTNKAWAFDGTNWVKISNKGLPTALEAMTMVPFFTYHISNVYVPTRYSVFMAFGGTDGTTINKKVYMSNDYGMTWTEGSAFVQLPEDVNPGYNAQGFVRNTIMYPSRATRPIEEWECPYIYLFGGYDADGQLNNTIWRGTLNRMTFKPLI